MIVCVEKKVLEDPAISGDENFGAITQKFCTFREGMTPCLDCMDTFYPTCVQVRCLNDLSLFVSDLDDISNCVDFIICLGGDGTLLYASSLFQVLSHSHHVYTRHLDAHASGQEHQRSSLF